MNDKELAILVHSNIHAVRLLSNYKASEMEIRISRAIIERFKDECLECKEIGEKLKNQKPKQSIFSKIMEAE